MAVVRSITSPRSSGTEQGRDVCVEVLSPTRRPGLYEGQSRSQQARPRPRVGKAEPRSTSALSARR